MLKYGSHEKNYKTLPNSGTAVATAISTDLLFTGTENLVIIEIESYVCVYESAILEMRSELCEEPLILDWFTAEFDQVNRAS